MGRGGGRVALHVREQLKCMELCLGVQRQPMESLWVRTKERKGKADAIVGVCYRLPDQEE